MAMAGKPLKDFFDSEIEPKRLCRNCEYFDCEGKDPRALAADYTGDCGMTGSPWFTPTADQGCNKFWPDSTRWPDCDHD